MTLSAVENLLNYSAIRYVTRADNDKAYCIVDDFIKHIYRAYNEK